MSAEQVPRRHRHPGEERLRFSLQLKSRLVLYSLLGAILLLSAPVLTSYVSLQRVIGETQIDLEQVVSLARLNLAASRQRIEYLDVALAGEGTAQLRIATEESERSFEDLNELFAREVTRERGEANRLQEIARVHALRMKLAGDAIRGAGPGQDWSRPSATPRIREGLEEVLPAAIEQEALAIEHSLEMLLSSAGSLRFTPWVDTASEVHLLADAARSLVASVAFQHETLRLVAQVQRVLYLAEDPRQLDLAQARSEDALRSWEISRKHSLEDRGFDALGARFRELTLLTQALVSDIHGEGLDAARERYRDEFEPVADEAIPTHLTRELTRAEVEMWSRFEKARRNADLTGWVAVCLLVAALVLVVTVPWITSRGLIRPILVVTEAARRIGQGELGARTGLHRSDELGDLAQTLDRMAQQLEQARDERLARRERLVVLGQLAGSVGHEVRNPLGVIRGGIYLLRDSMLGSDPETSRQLDRIERAVERANGIVTSLLDYAREPKRSIEAISIATVVEDALDDVRVPDHVKLEWTVDERAPSLHADRLQVEQILINLLENAIHAMPEGGQLGICLRRAADEVVIEVSDTGNGIPEGDRQRVFEPLYSGRSQGIGLGLTLSQRYAVQNGGRIECESQLGKGSTFRLVLPLAEETRDHAS